MSAAKPRVGSPSRPSGPEFTRVRSRPVRYRRHAGSDPQATPLLLVHGIACSSQAFAPTLEHLVRIHEPRAAVAPDMPGYGRSPGPRRALDMNELGAWLIDLMDVLGLPRAHVVGNSMGCQVALALARQAPDRVASLILTGPTTGDQIQPLWRYVLGLLADSLVERPAYNLTLARMSLQMGMRRYIATMRHLLKDHPIARADEVRCPALIVRGTRDLIIPKHVAQALATALPFGEYQEVERVAHAVQFSRPGALWDHATEFIARCEAAARAQD